LGKVGFQFPAEVDEAINAAIATYKRDIGSKKRRGIMKLKEGKSKYDLNGYKTLCKYFKAMQPVHKKYTWNEAMFADLFTIFSVNTIGRSDNVDDVLLSLIDWEVDSLTIIFGTTKSDQEGEKSQQKHAFANPYHPEICIILSLAVYVWCRHRGPGSGSQLFDGKDQNKRYYQILMDAVATIPSEINLGCNRADIGTHSNRKFAESTTVSRVNGPSTTQVQLRANQSTGRTQQCYMYSEEDGDRFVGRHVAQLLYTVDEFDVLPLHFSPTSLNSLNNYGWDKILPGYTEFYPESFKRVVPFLFAALVYHHHKGDLARLYPTNHPIFKQTIFTNTTLIDSLRDKVLLVHGYCGEASMEATGVPLDIKTAREVRSFRELYNATCRNTEIRIDQLSNRFEELLESLPQQICNRILETVTVEGVQPVTREQIRQIMVGVIQESNGALYNQIEQLRTLVVNNNNTMTGEVVQLPVHHTGDVHRWDGDGGIIHTVPFGFVWPSHDTSTMWNLWFFGNGNSRIGSYKFISPKVDLTTQVCRNNRSRTAKVVKKLLDLALAGGKITRLVNCITVENSLAVFDYSYQKLIDELYEIKPARMYEININTIANKIR
jgi:hypothetical protein